MEDISATKQELAKDLMSVIKQNKLLIDRVNALQSQIKSLQHDLLESTKNEFLHKGKAAQLRSQYRQSSNELKQARAKIIKLENKQ